MMTDDAANRSKGTADGLQAVSGIYFFSLVVHGSYGPIFEL
jgi:hypothetical protein